MDARPTILFTDGVISSEPHIGSNAFTVNNAKFLPEPRIGLAWSPRLDKTVVRAGFGMYNELQDALGYRMDQNAPFNPTYSIAALPVSQLPINPSAPVPAKALLVPGGVQPDLKMPTLISYSLRVEQEIDSEYVPHGRVTWDLMGTMSSSASMATRLSPQFARHRPVQARIQAPFRERWPVQLSRRVPSIFLQEGQRRIQLSRIRGPGFRAGNSNYNALQVDLNHRFSHDLALRGVYTWSKALDDGDSLNATTAGNAPGLVSNPYDIHADWGLATYDVRNIGVISAVYMLPFGRGKAYANSFGGFANYFRKRMVGEQHRYHPVRIPHYTATQLQPFKQWGHSQSGKAVRKP